MSARDEYGRFWADLERELPRLLPERNVTAEGATFRVSGGTSEHCHVVLPPRALDLHFRQSKRSHERKLITMCFPEAWFFGTSGDEIAKLLKGRGESVEVECIESLWCVTREWGAGEATVVYAELRRVAPQLRLWIAEVVADITPQIAG